MKGISLGVCAYKKPSATKARPMRSSSDCHDPASLATRSPPRRKNQSNWSSFGCSRLNPCKYTTKKWYFEAPAANILKPCQKSPEFSIAPEWRAPPAMQTCSSGKTAADCAAKRNRDPTWDDRKRSQPRMVVLPFLASQHQVFLGLSHQDTVTSGTKTWQGPWQPQQTQ